ncbi:hypothetical protein [Microbacterium timonense]|jgi:hypothetical protein|uniref:hypothetical protein n=1 Tax=Microbacterium timonense TaxID=2086576 RepID=UPI000D114490|nr:hypothetical protein [Microbacterium timonense]
MQITLRHDPARTIPVDDALRSPDERTIWARESAYAFAARNGLDDAAAERIALALEDVAAATGDDRKNLLLVGAEGRVVAPLTVFAAAEPLTDAEQAAFLWSPAALLPATTEVVASEHLGPGFSATLLERHGDHDFGFRRWLFVGENATVGAVLGPVAPYGLIFVEDAAADVMRESTLDGFIPARDDTRVRELDAAVTRVGEDWPL